MRNAWHAAAAVMMLFGSAEGATAQPRPEAGRSGAEGDAADREAFVQGLRNSPGRQVFAAIERNFPSEFPGFGEELYRMALAHLGDRPALERGAVAIMQRFMHSKRQEFRAAPAPQLLAAAERYLELYQALEREDPALCGRVFMSGSPGVVPARFQAQASALTITYLDAAGAGARGGAAPRPAEPPEADAAAWWEQLIALDDDGQAQAVLAEENAVDDAPPAIQCRIAILSFAAIGRMPPDSGANMAAFLVSEAYGAE